MGPSAQAHSGFPLSMSCLQDFLRRQGNKKSSLQTDKSGKSREEAVGKKVGVGGHKAEQSRGETGDARAASELLGATPSLEDPTTGVGILDRKCQ